MMDAMRLGGSIATSLAYAHAFAPALRVGCPLTTSIDECPCWKPRSEELDLGAGACTNAQHARVFREAGKDRRHQQVNAIPKRRKFRPLLIVCSGLLVECGLKLMAIH